MINDLMAKGINPENTPHLVAIPIPDNIHSSEKIKDFLTNIFGTDVTTAVYAEKEISKEPENNVFNLFEDILPKTSDKDIDDSYEDNP